MEIIEDDELPFTFSGFELLKGKDQSNGCKIHRNKLSFNFKASVSRCNLSQFRSSRMKLSWLSHTWLDLQYEISQYAQVAEVIFRKDPSRAINQLNSAKNNAVENPTAICTSSLDLQSTQLKDFADSSFANKLTILLKKLGDILFLTDRNNHSVPIHLKSYKARQVIQSFIEGERIAFSDLIDTVFSFSKWAPISHLRSSNSYPCLDRQQISNLFLM